ncbi:MAG TPA: sigma-54 dependent transcriptional regulator [Bdellovibrionota bacterium]|nr:sigma-54 dependent transcriptional regulator [Bdellovibrionota bacterium]
MAIETKLSILVVDDDESTRLYLKTVLGNKYDVLLAESGVEALDILTREPTELILLDLILKDDEDGLALLRKIKKLRDDIQIIIISGVRMVSTVVKAMKEGASDYINKPFEREELFLALSRVLEKRQLQKDNILLKEQLGNLSASNDLIIGNSQTITKVKRDIERLKGHNVNVFLMGQTGTGKEMFARRLHQQEEEPQRPFVSVNCAAIPETLIESVLFGHEKGSFTGATQTRIGKFELANGGDIFLDEITCLNPDLQAKFLRVLEEKEVERIGNPAPKKINFRVISAANDDIAKKVEAGEFRTDLFYRLNTVMIQLPSLNERKDDIIPLAEYFLSKYRRTQIPKVLSEDVKTLLKEHDWRGNVRELKNTIENILIFSKGMVIQAEDVPFFQNELSSPLNDSSRACDNETAESQPVHNSTIPDKSDAKYQELLKQYEKALIQKRLEKNRWSKTKTCKDLGITRNKLYRKMAELGIEF